MNDAFAARVYPTILYVLNLLDRIHDRRTGEPTPDEELPRLKQHLGQLESRGTDERDYELAKRALVYWIDEVLINSPWSYAGQWKDHTLEREFYDSRDRAWEFYEKAKIARTLSRPDALEVFYLCVALGFQGIYREGDFGPSAGPRGNRPAPQPTPQPGMKSDSGSWFDKGAGNVPGDERTWGIPGGKGPARNDMIDDSVFAARRGSGPGRAPAGTALDLPVTLEEWAGPVYAQIAPGKLRPFQPVSPPESQRDARPLQGKRRFGRSMVLVGWMIFIAAGLGIWRYVTWR